MIVLRPYHESDAPAVGRLIADTFGAYNLSEFTPQARDELLGPFRHARSPEPQHKTGIAEALQAEMVIVAVESTPPLNPSFGYAQDRTRTPHGGEEGGAIVGVLRGRPDKLQSLFVRADHQRQGIGRRLVERFEAQCRRAGSTAIKVQATLYAVPFYHRIGYVRSTGVRSMRIFDGARFPYQPMKKVLRAREEGAP